MIDSLEIYKEALAFAKNNTAENDRLKSWYLQLVTTTFYELTAKKTSPLISALCQSNDINFAPKNFQILPTQIPFEGLSSADLFIIVHGLNAAFAENLDSSLNFFMKNKDTVFRGVSLSEQGLQLLMKILKVLDKSLGKINGKYKNLLSLSEERNKEDKKIIDTIKKVQLALQEEVLHAQNTLKNISDIRDDIDFRSMREPINQLIQLYDSLDDILQTHPQENIQSGYENLLDDCLSFKDYIEQSLEMLGAEIIDEINIPYEPGKHIIKNGRSPSSRQVTVSKILRIGLIYKGQVLRKADIEIEEENFGEDRN